MPELSERIVQRAERKFESGNDHFAARGILASIAILLSEPQVRDAILLDSNKGIVRMLEEKGAEGEVYAVRQDLGNGEQDSTDYVRVTSRDGMATHVPRNREYGSEAVVRDSTSDIDS